LGNGGERILKYIPSAHPTELTSTGRAERIVHLLRVARVGPSEEILDIGCGYGDIALGLAKLGFQVIGADVFLPGVRAASKAASEMGLGAMFLMSPVESLALKDQVASIVVCYNIWEHVPNPRILLDQITRVLRREGVLFLVVPNRFWIMETHYRLPFLSWLPQRLADSYVRISRKGLRYDVDCPTWWELDSSLRNAGFEVNNLNLYVLKNFKKLYPSPEYLGTIKYRIGCVLSTAFRLLPDFIARLLADSFSEAFFVVARLDSGRDNRLKGFIE
jgi:SAM-dependent methyltransferase